MRPLKRFLLAFVLLLFSAPVYAADETELWRITFETSWLGPMEAHFELKFDGQELHGVSKSGSARILANLPGEHSVDNGLAVFVASQGEDGSYSGTFLAPWQEGELQITFDGDTLHGSAADGAFAGSVSGRRVETAQVIRDYTAAIHAFDDVVQSKIFAPEDLESSGYKQFRKVFGEIAAAAEDDIDMLFGFHLAWKNDPFSHFQLRRSPQSAKEMFSYFDNYRVGFEAATVAIEGGTAVLKVRTMMGADTIEQIEAAFDRIAESDVDTLIIDLRGNGGGAFAVKPLVEHVIDEPLDAGYFLSQVWNRENDRLPTTDEVMAAKPWSGWSIVAFWEAVQSEEIMRIQMQPAEPNFNGEVFVLVDNKTASAAEMAADALRASGVATLVGERTAGEMLSQSMFDVTDGFVVTLPVADYYSLQNGRIEGEGVMPHIGSSSEKALDVARQRAGAAPGK